ncbi:probable LRR receptor-like serine/threonine-protein kinase At3g47570 [Vitis riparia]|uniref:probable LRR receptor-like serine/threonine-protein kinase At3g47570 n=1 Tax=Vitis riparia TaxID=96939 RepID=UPI00155AB2AF|nr:probable LRR receptor-like serine/threonine-protein kinase At3g47570 [Vitis riparia]
MIHPRLSNLTSLQLLDLSNNSFYGQLQLDFSHLSLLQNINLARNSINGRIPVGLSHCYNLEEIYFEHNQLIGNLPSELGDLPRLRILDVAANNLTGVIAPTFGNLTSLTVLSLARNQFFAKIPNELGHLHNLQRLQLSENQFEGKIPYSIYNISSLIYLSVAENMLVGELPTDMGLALPNLAEVYLAHNQLEGPIPSSFSNASQIQVLDFSSNHFQGPVPLLGNMNNLRLLHLGLNNLSSTTKLNLQVFNSLANSTQLEFLYLNDNQLAGELPTSVANLSTHLLEFCIGSNFLTGSIPKGFERFQNLWALDIHQNLFTGMIPNSLGKLQQLQRLLVDNNMLSGEIPDIFGNLTRLFLLTMGYNQFSGRIPTSIGECKNLKRLGLRQNRVNGSIPKEIFRLLDIIEIYLAHNELSGSLPALVESLEHLEVLDASNNQLSGNISTTIGSCLSLRSFNIATNKLSGAIPVSMGKLIALESLDLSSNSLTGQIPEELQDLLYLQILNLSFNDLEGPVPRKGVFMNLTWLSLTGNNKLCGSDPEAAGKLRIPTCITKVKSNRHLILKIVIPVASFTLLMCAACITWMLISQNKKKRRGTTFPSPCFKALPPKISYSDIQHATNDFSPENLVGKGGFGSVYKGVFRTGENGVNTIFAVKVIDLQQGEASENFNAECEVLRNIQHRNLVKVITSCSSIDKRRVEFKALVMEFMSNGSLEKWLYPEDTNSGLALTLIQRLNIAIDVASALNYLHHDCDPPVVHCDLKPANVLLDYNMGAHVGDFGLARFLWKNPSEDESSTIGLKGSIGYIAPECSLGSRISTSRDVYSFGILLLEIFTAKKPTDDMFQEGLNQNKLASALLINQFLDMADKRLFNNDACTDYSIFTSSSGGINSIGTSSNTLSHWKIKTEECITAIIHVGLSCAAHSTTDRSTMREALTKLHDIKAFLLDL